MSDTWFMWQCKASLLKGLVLFKPCLKPKHTVCCDMEVMKIVVKLVSNHPSSSAYSSFSRDPQTSLSLATSSSTPGEELSKASS